MTYNNTYVLIEMQQLAQIVKVRKVKLLCHRNISCFLCLFWGPTRLSQLE